MKDSPLILQGRIRKRSFPLRKYHRTDGEGVFDHSCLVRRELNSLVLVMSTDGIEDYREQIRSLGEKIISVVKDYFEVSVSVAVSSRKESLGEFGAFCTRP